VAKTKEISNPGERELNRLQVERFASLTDLPTDEIAGASIATLTERLEWRVDPWWFLFVRVCGQVVKVDPVTGLKYPVAGATVQVRDVDCDWFWLFPPHWPWSWGFRFGPCEWEELASTTTDECGRFCVWIPRFDIDWIVRWRSQRVCFGEILRRPSVADILTPHLPPSPNPPDPESLSALLESRADLASAIGPAHSEAILAAARSHTVGAPTSRLEGVLKANAFGRTVPPPVPAELRVLDPADAHIALANLAGVEARSRAELDLAQSYGPFLRCFDVEVPEWVPFFSVPDIVFVVTQDVDGDGDEEVIYDGAFDLPWGVWPVADVELDASPTAVASPMPGCVPPVSCETQATIYSVGFMDVLDPEYFDATSGFARRMNEPAPPTTPPSSTAPLCETLQLFGCTDVKSAKYYRVLCEYAVGDGLTPPAAFGAQLPLIPPPWQVVSLPPSSTPQTVVPVDGEGWFSILGPDWTPIDLLMVWSPPANGVYRLTLQVGTGTPGSITSIASAESNPLTIVVDNGYPIVSFKATGWKYASVAGWTPFTPGDPCLLIERASKEAVVVQLEYSVSAAHLFSASLTPGGCGVSVPEKSGASPKDPTVPGGYRYDGPFDNSLSGVAEYRVDGDQPSGCYTWTLTAYSRAFSPDDPSGLDVNPSSKLAWNWVSLPIYVDPSISVAIVEQK
jgi:hypothetical protein